MSQTLVDFSVLKSLAELAEDDATFVPRVLGAFIKDSKAQMEAIQVQFSGAEMAPFAKGVHSLLSSSQNVGATAFADLCLEIQNLGPNPDQSQVAPLLKPLLRTYQDTLPILEKIIATGILPQE